ncbi:MAG TPA: carboxypeptidase regulatory-like domain-containing protein, partial [Chitinophagaceae bacterium]
MRFLLFCLVFLTIISANAQDSLGLITGSLIDEKRKPVEGATVQLIDLENNASKSVLSDKDGYFEIPNIPFGYKKLLITSISFQQLTIDSIYFRAERYDFNLNDIILKPSTEQNRQEVIVYAEKPLIESKEGNITFNAGESALSAGSNASDLLTNVPLVTKDPDGKIMVRGKEPKILIDDKPVELNQQQLQDFLESLPGSSIEKIEVMTNPPPQYANEQGGVINITTRKGKVGKTGRINLTAGTRGQYNLSGNYNYRRQGLVISINAGVGYNEFNGEGYSIRKNTYRDSTNYFNTNNISDNTNLRPNFRGTIDYDINKKHNLNLAINYNQNNYDNNNETEFQNINRFDSLYRLRERLINSTGESFNPNVSLSYTLKTGRQGESFRVIANNNYSFSNSERAFYQEHFYPDFS